MLVTSRLKLQFCFWDAARETLSGARRVTVGSQFPRHVRSAARRVSPAARTHPRPRQAWCVHSRLRRHEGANWARAGVAKKEVKVNESRPDPSPAPDFSEVEKAVEQYRKLHPEVDEALRIFEVSEHAYEAALEAMYGPHISWSNSANPTAT